MDYAKDKLKEINDAIVKAAREMPEHNRNFMNLMNGVLKDGAISVKNKELITVSLGVALGCEWCIILHTKKALDAGATREEILEAGYVAVMMAGGPAMMHFIPMLKALDELTKEQ